MINYKGYTIQEDPDASYRKAYMYYITEEGIQHDADYDGYSYQYCGNCQWANDIEEAKLRIDELTDDDKKL